MVLRPTDRGRQFASGSLGFCLAAILTITAVSERGTSLDWALMCFAIATPLLAAFLLFAPSEGQRVLFSFGLGFFCFTIGQLSTVSGIVLAIHNIAPNAALIFGTLSGILLIYFLLRVYLARDG